MNELDTIEFEDPSTAILAIGMKISDVVFDTFSGAYPDCAEVYEISNRDRNHPIEIALDNFSESCDDLLYFQANEKAIDLSTFRPFEIFIENENEFHTKLLFAIDEVSRPIHNEKISIVQKSNPEMAKLYSKMSNDLKILIDAVTKTNAGKFVSSKPALSQE